MSEIKQYIKQNFANGQVLSEKALNHIEDGIAANADAIIELNQLHPVDDTIIITDTDAEGKGIRVAIAPVEGNALEAVDGGLFVPVTGAALYIAGDGIEVIDNKISVKLADITHGLAVVDGALTVNLATSENDGAMSKEDKSLLDSLKEDKLLLDSLPEELEEINNVLDTLTDSLKDLNDSSTWTWGDFN